MLPFLVFGFFAETIASSVGFGASTILLPLSLLYFDFKTALTLVAFFHLFGTFFRSYFFRAGLDRKVLLQFGVPSVIFGIIGAGLANQLTETLLKQFLGAFLIFYGLFSLWRKDFQVKPKLTNLVLGGSLSGIIAGLIGTGGALRATFLSSFKRKKAEYLATTAIVALMVDLTRIPVYLKQGFLSSTLFGALPFLFVTAFIATYLGKQIANFLPAKLFEKVVILAITAAGFVFLFRPI